MDISHLWGKRAHVAPLGLWDIGIRFSINMSPRPDKPGFKTGAKKLEIFPHHIY